MVEPVAPELSWWGTVVAILALGVSVVGYWRTRDRLHLAVAILLAVAIFLILAGLAVVRYY